MVLGFDGVDHRWLNEYLDADAAVPSSERRFPHLLRLREEGTLAKLMSEIPPESPVAWASVITGVNPGRHGIFDFVRPGARYRPVNGMVDVQRMRLLLGKVPVRAPQVRSRLAVPTFLERIHAAGYPILALRQPMLFPAQPLPGSRRLSGLGTPDIAGGAGFYAVWSSRPTFPEGDTIFGGVQIPLDPTKEREFDTYLAGPVDPSLGRGDDGRLLRTRVPLRFRIERGLDRPAVAVELAGRTEIVPVGERSPFMVVPFELQTLPRITIRGHVRFEVKKIDPLVVLADPVNIYAPTAPIPLTSPREYAGELFERYGPFETVGWTEQTFALNDGYQDDEGFLKDLLEDMDRSAGLLMGEIESGGSCVFQVFTATDRGMHCFYRYYDPEHAAYRPGRMEALGDPIGLLFARMDRIVGDVMGRLEEDDVLLLCSDHGFETWRWGVNVNQWLLENGYLALRQDVVEQHQTLAGFSFEGGLGADAVDWSQTKAYAMGLGQIYLNLRGREEEGIVDPKDASALAREIREKLLTLEHEGQRVVREIYLLKELYSGPKVDEAAELQIGFEAAYRVSWQTALLGGLGGRVVEVNSRPWSGDHCSTDISVVPGILMANRKIPQAFEDRPYNVRDIAPTACEFFGVEAEDLEGRSVLPTAP